MSTKLSKEEIIAKHRYNIGAQIKKARESQDMLIREVSVRANVTDKVVNAIENGDNCTFNSLIAVTRVLGLKLTLTPATKATPKRKPA